MLERLTAVTLAAFLCAAPQLAAAGPTLLFDPGNGKVLYAEDQDNQWHPASLTKIMTAYLTFEALKSGRLTLEQKIPVSENAHGQPPSKVGLPVGAEMSVDMALRALIVKSANDVAVMLAEAIGGSEEAFVKKMNDTAQRFGMTRTHFANPSGLPAPDQITTARDLAKLARAVLQDFPEHVRLWALADMQIGRRRLRTHNGLIRTYEGADGLKTGFICDSGYNVVASASRDGRRLVAIVLGEVSGRDRNVRAASLLEHGFETYGWKQMFDNTTVELAARGQRPQGRDEHPPAARFVALRRTQAAAPARGQEERRRGCCSAGQSESGKGRIRWSHAGWGRAGRGESKVQAGCWWSRIRRAGQVNAIACGGLPVRAPAPLKRSVRAFC